MREAFKQLCVEWLKAKREGQPIEEIETHMHDLWGWLTDEEQAYFRLEIDWPPSE